MSQKLAHTTSFPTLHQGISDFLLLAQLNEKLEKRREEQETWAKIFKKMRYRYYKAITYNRY